MTEHVVWIAGWGMSDHTVWIEGWPFYLPPTPTVIPAEPT